MKKLLLLLAVILAAATGARADDVSIPTDSDHPFDLTLGTLEGNGLNINSANEIDNGRNGYKSTFTLDNREDADYYLLNFKAGTQRSDAHFLVTITTDDGTVVLSKDIPLENNGTWTCNIPYSVKTGRMEKGHYTLVFDFISTGNNYVARLADIAFKKPLRLEPGDEVDIQNPEFDDAMNGWTLTGGGQGNVQYTTFGNSCCVKHYNGGTGELRQTVVGLPDGVYLFCLGAYDSYSNPSVSPDTYVYLNDRLIPMKTAYDESVGYRNIWRWYGGKTNNSYRRTAAGRFVPTHQLDWNEALAMAERLYENCVVTTITSGVATFGWKKTDNRSTRVTYDHARLVYLSDDLSQQFDEAALRTQHLREQLTDRLQALQTELTAKRPHAPQAIAETNVLVNADIAYTTDNELIDAILHAEHLLERLQLPFYELSLSGAPVGDASELSVQLAAAGIQTTDSIALKVNGTPTAADFTTLKTLKNLMELDLSDAALTELPNNAFQDLRLLTWVTLPAHLETIGDYTFYNNYSLRDMAMPATLKNIGVQAFRSCISLDRAVIADGVAVSNEAYYGSGIRSIALPPSMYTVPYGLCTGCSNLTDIRFNGQVAINENAFSGCTALTELNLPESVQWMTSWCFGGCTSLTSVTLPGMLKYVYRPFHNCKNLTDITCLTIAPPYPRGAHIRGDIGDKGCTLRVPQQAVDDYQAATLWNEFDIVPIDQLPPTLGIYAPLTFDASATWPADYHPDMDMGMSVSYWGGNVSGATGRGMLTNDGRQMLSLGEMRQFYNFYNCRSYGNADKMQFFTSLINNGPMRADNITVELRFMPGYWENIALPFDVRIGDIEVYVKGVGQQLCDVPFAIYGYDATKRAEGDLDHAWVRMTADSILHAGRGYIWQTTLNGYHAQLETPESQFFVHALQTVNKPMFFRTDNVEVPLQKIYSEFAHNRSWNFIGNPYPSFFDIRWMDTTAPIVVWDYTQSTNHYWAYSPLDDDYILHPGQAFFMQRPLDGETVVFDREGRQHDLVPRDYIPAGARRMAAAKKQRQVVNLMLSGSNGQDGQLTLDRTRFVINEAASLDYEQGRDAPKFSNPGGTDLYTHRDGVRYAIDERPLADGLVSLGLSVPAAGTYTLSLGGQPLPSLVGEGCPKGGVGSVTLLDHEAGTETVLTEDGYTFQAEAGTHDARFTLRLGAAATAVQSVAVLQQQTGQLYDLQGRPVTNPQPGLYIINNKKVIIK